VKRFDSVRTTNFGVCSPLFLCFVLQRWRRRWFTLKQGELPGQFFLEYFTDTSCRKRKGIIDLDQVEQVDAGLRLDRQSIKFQHMFDMKTPSRTYYMNAETEQDMRDWVMVICQVCNLQETEEKNVADSSPAQCKLTENFPAIFSDD
jgi:hypothetical protein